MKLANAPGRKQAKRLAAEKGGSWKYYQDDPSVIHATSIKTKKRRSI